MTDGDLGFRPLHRRTVSQQIRDQLVERIAGGDLPPGAALPSERALSEQFGVARTSVREAIQGLVSVGLVERRGNRAHVTEHLPEVSVPVDRRKDAVRQLFETRRVLELPIFELAAERATPDQRTEVARVAAAFTDDLGLDEFRRLDRRFHSLVASACGNPLLVEVHHKVLDALFRSEDFDSLLYAEANEATVADLVREAGRDHAAIASALVAGDLVRIVTAAETHLTNVERRMLDDLV